MTGRRLVVIDTDLALGEPGEKVDDGCALALALASPELDVGLVTTVAGNVDVCTATTRATAFLDRLGRGDVAVVPGGGPDGAAAARALVTWALDDPGELTVIALGPLSNLAAAFAAEVDVASALAEVVVMGGRFLTPGPAEFNTRTDPWAVRTVLESGARLKFVGLDVTSRVALGAAEVDRLAAGPPTAGYLAEQIRARLAVLAPQGVSACPMHDPLAVLALTHRHLITWRAAWVAVEIGDGEERGQTTVCLLDDGAAHLATCEVAVDVDARAARDVLVERLLTLP
jgi:purine nucleosidase